MEDEKYESLQHSLVSIATELYRFQRVFEKAVGRLDIDEQKKYISQYTWFSRRVLKALEESNLKLVDLDGQEYDPGMAVTPLNIDEFETDEILYIQQTIEPIVMQGDSVMKTGTVVLGRAEK